jgi:osmotically-inducible protein OsmY
VLVVIDPEVERQVRKAVEADLQLDQQALELTFSARNSCLVIDGLAGRLADKRRLSMIASTVPGVREVCNNVLVRAEIERSDEEIRSRVLDSLALDPTIDETKIEIAVANGVVTLRGVVPSLASKRLAGVLCWWVAGVREVENKLDLLADEEDNDSELTEAVRAALEADYLVDSTSITVHALDGVIILRGAVFSEGERAAAENDAWYVLGVKDVNNLLKVSPARPPQTQVQD